MSEQTDFIKDAMGAVPKPIRRLAYTFALLWLALQIVGGLIALAILSAVGYGIFEGAKTLITLTK